MLVKASGTSYGISDYTTAALAAGLKLIAWSIERTGPLASPERDDFYYATVSNLTTNDGDIMVMLKALYDAGVIGVFSDWPATTTFFANCMASTGDGSGTVQMNVAQLGPRPNYLVNNMSSSDLKTTLQECP